MVLLSLVLFLSSCIRETLQTITRSLSKHRRGHYLAPPKVGIGLSQKFKKIDREQQSQPVAKRENTAGLKRNFFCQIKKMIY